MLPGPIQVSEEPRACSSFRFSDLSFYTIWVSVAKNQIVVGVFLVQNPGILCCPPCTGPWCPCPVFYTSCFPSAWPGSCIMCAEPCVSVQLGLFSQQSPGVLHSHPCQLGSAHACRRAVLNECALGSFFPYKLPLHKAACIDLKSGLF